MHYLYQPTAVETLMVRGRYAWQGLGDASEAEERWERYRQTGSPIEVWRAARTTAGATLLSHAVMSDAGVERLKLRWRREGHASQSLTLTFEANSVLVSDGKTWHSEELPQGYGVVVPMLSLAQLAMPFDLASEQGHQATAYLVALRDNAFHCHTATASYAPLGFREVIIKDEALRARGWRMEAHGIPSQSLWFDRHGTCLAAHREGDAEAHLVEWTRFG